MTNNSRKRLVRKEEHRLFVAACETFYRSPESEKERLSLCLDHRYKTSTFNPYDRRRAKRRSIRTEKMLDRIRRRINDDNKFVTEKKGADA